MWLYPLPALIAIIMWLGLFFSTGKYFAIGGTIVMSIGAVMFLLRSYIKKEWPFEFKQQL